LGYGMISPKFCFGTSGAADITPTDCITSWSQIIDTLDTSQFLNTSATAQTKAGELTVQGGLIASGLVANTSGKVIVGGGSASPSSSVPLTVNGQVRLTGAGGTAATTNAYLVAGGSGGDASWTPSRCGT